MNVLHEVYGPGVYNMKLEHKSIAVTDSKVIDIATLNSPHHIDMNPSDAGNYDRVIVMQMIREIAQTVPMQCNTTKSVAGAGGAAADVVRYKTVVLNEVDRMSRSAQHALRRTMEKYIATCRLILICNSTCRLIAPLRSRCLGIRVPAHTRDNLAKAIARVCAGEGLGEPSSHFIDTLAERAQGNLRRGLLMFEAAVMTHVDLKSNGMTIPQADWQVYIEEIAADVTAEQTPKRLHEVRLKFYDLLGQCISGETILKTLVDGLLLSVPSRVHKNVIQLAAQFDHNMKLGTKPILHLEAFTASVMALLKNSV